MKPELAYKGENEVGEGPIWDSQKSELLWVDINKGLLHRLALASGEVASLSIGCHLGAIGLYSENQYVAAVRDGFALIDRSNGSIEYLAKVLNDDGIRFNDGKCDPKGRFLAGTMRFQPQPGTAALYSCDETGLVTTLLEGVGLSNGLAWSQHGTSLFYIDTLSREIAKFEYDLESPSLRNRAVHYRFGDSDGSPDGMTMDRDGNLWVALWGGGRVVVIDQSGKLIDQILLPVSQVTSVTFGGANLDQLFITSARIRLTAEELAAQPLAGSLFVVDPGTSGFLEPRFGLGRGAE